MKNTRGAYFTAFELAELRRCIDLALDATPRECPAATAAVIGIAQTLEVSAARSRRDREHVADAYEEAMQRRRLIPVTEW